MKKGDKRFYCLMWDHRPESNKATFILTIYAKDIKEALKKAQLRCWICPNSRTHMLAWPWATVFKIADDKSLLY